MVESSVKSKTYGYIAVAAVSIIVIIALKLLAWTYSENRISPIINNPANQTQEVTLIRDQAGLSAASQELDNSDIDAGLTNGMTALDAVSSEF